MLSYGFLQESVSAVLSYLDILEYSEDLKGRYLKAYDDIFQYFESVGITDYRGDVTSQYRKNLQCRLSGGILSNKRYHLFSRMSFMIDDFYAGEPFKMKYGRGIRYKVSLDDYYQVKVDAFETYLQGRLSMISIPGFVSIGRDFFRYLQDKDVKRSEDITDDDIIQFIQEEHESHPASMNNVCCVIRRIVSFLEPEGCNVRNGSVSYKTAPTRRKIYSALDEEELRIILETPDRNTPMGKRDYAVLLLASFTGLRAIDIANFKFESYDRNEKSIHIIQHKTSRLIGLPVPIEVIHAIDDYVDNGRPVSDSPYIFLTVDKPPRKLSDASSVRNILLRQLRLNRLGSMPGKGRGFHSFRRTMGKWLLGASVNPEMISQVLGHRDGEVLKRYLPLSEELMRDCTLGFESAPLRAEVYA